MSWSPMKTGKVLKNQNALKLPRKSYLAVQTLDLESYISQVIKVIFYPSQSPVIIITNESHTFSCFFMQAQFAFAVRFNLVSDTPTRKTS